MGIVVKRGGLLTTVQDQGRIGYQDQGFSPSGAMDRRAFELANLLLDNDLNSALLEVFFMGPQLEFDEENCFVITGADLKATLNGKMLVVNTVYSAKAGDVLDFPQKPPELGMRAYIAFAGGLDVPVLMGSRSTYLKGKMGGVEGRGLKNGDAVKFLAPKAKLPKMDKRTVPQNFYSTYGGSHITLRVVLGPQEDMFTEQGMHTFLHSFYTVTPNADRMGTRFDGPEIEHVGKADIISDGIAFGAVQVPSEGKPIVMLADRQTIGGYSKIANVISADIPKLVQRQPGDIVSFEAIGIDDAQKLLKAQKQQLAEMAAAWQ